MFSSQGGISYTPTKVLAWLRNRRAEQQFNIAPSNIAPGSSSTSGPSNSGPSNSGHHHFESPPEEPVQPSIPRASEATLIMDEVDSRRNNIPSDTEEDIAEDIDASSDYSDDPIDPPDETDVPVCRICLQPGEPASAATKGHGKLIKIGCKCRGAMGLCHKKCGVTWFTPRARGKAEGLACELRWKLTWIVECEICGSNVANDLQQDVIASCESNLRRLREEHKAASEQNARN